MQSDTPNPHIEALRQEIHHRKLVPVVGAGVSKLVAGIPLWRGVIDDGIRHIKASGVSTDAEIQAIRELLTAKELVPAAQRVREIMGAPGGEFPTWLAHLFGVQRYDVPPNSTHAIDSIVNLQCPLIATTNYDKLLSELHYDYFAAVTWQDPPRMQVALREGARVLHLHGVYDIPDSVVFGQSDYDRIVADSAYQMVLSTLWLDRTLLFIGCSFDGLKDPDFSRLLMWAQDTFRGSRYKHYALVRTGTSTPEERRTWLNEWRVQVIEYGHGYSDLPAWIDFMNPRLTEALAVRQAQRGQLTAASLAASGVGGTSPTANDVIDIPRYIQFVKQAVQDAIGTQPLTIQEAPASLNTQLYTMTIQGEGVAAPTYSLTSALRAFRQLALVGEPGSGKSQLMRQETMRLCQEYEQSALRAHTAPAEQKVEIPILVDLIGYSGEAIVDLVRRTFQRAGVDIPVEAVMHLALQGALHLFLDDFDWVKPEYSAGLLVALRSWRQAYPNCPMVVSTQRTRNGHRLEFPTFTIMPLKGHDIRDFLTGTLGLSEEDAFAIADGFPSEFQDLLSLPLTLKMLAVVYLNGQRRIPQSRSALYAMCIDILIDRSDKVKVLSLTAKWMQDNGRYNLSMVEFAKLLQEWISATDNALGVSHLASIDMLRLRTELQQSELFRSTDDGGVEFIHRTFVAYLGALDITVGELGTLVTKSEWETSLLLWASMHPIATTNALLEHLTGNPVLLGAVIRERSAQRATVPSHAITIPEWFETLVEHFNRLANDFEVLHERRWGVAIPHPPLQAIIAPPGPANGYALVWQSRPEGETASILWLPHDTLISAVHGARHALTRERTPVVIWLFPVWLLQKYHPVEVAYLWVLRSILNMLVLVNWLWSPNIHWPAGIERPHWAVTTLMERYAYYREFIEGLPDAIKERLPLYARGDFDLVADVREGADVQSGVTYAYLPNAGLGAGMSIHQRLIGAGDTGQTPILVEGENGRWTANLDNRTQEVLHLQAEMLNHLADTRVTHQAQKWIRDDLEKYLPGYPPAEW
jgi:hypothetical protein